MMKIIHDTETIISTDTILGRCHKMAIWDSILILSGCKPLGHSDEFLICSLRLARIAVSNTCILEFEILITAECITTDIESNSQQRRELM